MTDNEYDENFKRYMLHMKRFHKAHPPNDTVLRDTIRELERSEKWDQIMGWIGTAVAPPPPWEDIYEWEEPVLPYEVIIRAPGHLPGNARVNEFHEVMKVLGEIDNPKAEFSVYHKNIQIIAYSQEGVITTQDVGRVLYGTMRRLGVSPAFE